MGRPKLRRSRRIISLVDNETVHKIRKGQGSEDLAEEALQILVDRGEILGYFRTDWGDKYDILGIDFFVWPEPGWLIPLQVKSSHLGKEEHLENNSFVTCCIVVEPFLSPGELAEKTLEELGLSVKFLESILIG